MKFVRFITMTSAAGMLTLSMVGVAAADVSSPDTTVAMNSVTTGPDSVLDIKVDNSSKTELSNDNVVKILNVNVQGAATGDVTAKDNTTVGGVGSGNASNNNDVTNAVTIDNSSAPGTGGGSGGGTPGGSGGSGQGSGSGGPLAVANGVGGSGGGVLGASTGGLGSGSPAMLPVTGPSSPIDVSALRAAWHPQTNVPGVNLANTANGMNALMLIFASVLSLIGATGSAIYSRRKQLQIS